MKLESADITAVDFLLTPSEYDDICKRGGIISKETEILCNTNELYVKQNYPILSLTFILGLDWLTFVFDFELAFFVYGKAEFYRGLQLVLICEKEQWPGHKAIAIYLCFNPIQLSLTLLGVYSLALLVLIIKWL